MAGMRSMIDRLLSWVYIRRIWGGRCPDYDPGCISCVKWAEHDWLFHDKAHPEDRLKALEDVDGR